MFLDPDVFVVFTGCPVMRVGETSGHRGIFLWRELVAFSCVVCLFSSLRGSVLLVESQLISLSAASLTCYTPQGCVDCMCAKSLQSYPTLCNPVDRSPPGSAVCGILQARILKWIAIAFSRGIFCS